MGRYEIDPMAEARSAWAQEKGNRDDWLLTSDAEDQYTKEQLEAAYEIGAPILERIERLEQLCRDMYQIHVAEREWHGALPHEHITGRMDALGLLEQPCE